MAIAKEQIIAMLAYPRLHLRDARDLTDCHHDGLYDQFDPDCADCHHQAECAWLHSNDEFVDLCSKPIPQLIEALDFARMQVDADLLRYRHDTLSCRCEACFWLRGAAAILDRYYREA